MIYFRENFLHSRRALVRLACAGMLAISSIAAFGQTSSVVDTGWNSTTSTSLQAAGRILNQTGFGPTAAEILNVEAIGLNNYLNQQLAQPAYQIPATYPLPVTFGDCGSLECTTEYYWWNDILFGQDQLRQRVAWELSKLFVVSADTIDPRYMPQYLNVLSKDAFGNWLTLMTDVALSPAMGEYLNMLNSPAPSGSGTANENFAREFMQLFSIGTSALNQDGSLKLDGNGNPIPNYTGAQVQSFALAYTGWTFGNNDCSAPSSLQYYWYENPVGQTCPMAPVASAHSTVQKTLLRGTVLPAGQSPQDDLNGAIQNIFNDPSLPPFVCRRLIQDLVKSNPSPAYISRVAGVFINNGSGVRGDMTAVLRAILLDPEARAADAVGTPDPNGGRMRDPVTWWSSVLRTIQGTSSAQLPNVGVYDGVFGLWLYDLDQQPRNVPSVFSYYSPNFQLQGTSLYAPEFQNENVYTIVWMSLHLQDALNSTFEMNGSTQSYFNLDLSPTSIWANFVRENGPTALVNLLDALLMHGKMTTDMQQAIVASIQNQPADTMARCAVYLIVSSPQYRVMD